MNINFKRIEWTDILEPTNTRDYFHVIGNHLIGEFCIGWEPWKEVKLYTLYFNDARIGRYHSMGAAINFANDHVHETLLPCIDTTELEEIKS